MFANIQPVAPPFWVIFALLGLLSWAWLSHRILENPRGDVGTGIGLRLISLYARIFHRLEVRGLEHVPLDMAPNKLILVANHTAGIDPILIQVACPFYVRWMMAKDMMLPSLDWLWRWLEVISVDRFGRDAASAREAIRHIERGGVIGVFPEGGLERPPRQVRPFLPGVGLLIAKTGARVLPAVIEGTPQVNPVWKSLTRRSRSRVTFYPIIDYSQGRMSASAIAVDLRRRYIDWTGWPANDEPRAPNDQGPLTRPVS